MTKQTNPYRNLSCYTLAKLPIGSEMVQIQRVTAGEPFDDYGAYFVDEETLERRILINNRLSGPALDSVVLHELLHAVSDIYGLGLSEKTIRVIEQGIGQAMPVWNGAYLSEERDSQGYFGSCEGGC